MKYYQSGKFMRSMCAAVLFTSASILGFAEPAMAEEAVMAEEPLMAEEPMDWYLGAGLGISSLSPDTSNSIYRVSDRHDVAWQVLAGLKFGEKLAAEFDYSDLGQADLEYIATSEAASAIHYQQASLTALWYGDNPNDNAIRPFVRGGVTYSDHSYSDSNNPQQTLEVDEFGLTFGVGIEKRDLPNGLSFRVEARGFTESAAMLNLGIVKHFPH